jgi:hypothetical protein
MYVYNIAYLLKKTFTPTSKGSLLIVIQPKVMMIPLQTFPRKHFVSGPAKYVGEMYAQCNKRGPIALLFTPVIQLLNANIRSRFMDNTTDSLKEISNKYRCFKCLHFIRYMRTKDEIISAINNKYQYRVMFQKANMKYSRMYSSSYRSSATADALSEQNGC